MWTILVHIFIIEKNIMKNIWVYQNFMMLRALAQVYSQKT